jgi:hypothetical protein
MVDLVDHQEIAELVVEVELQQLDKIINHLTQVEMVEQELLIQLLDQQ